eukprot:5132026-Prymnesium_polylepis.1
MAAFALVLSRRGSSLAPALLYALLFSASPCRRRRRASPFSCLSRAMRVFCMDFVQLYGRSVQPKNQHASRARDKRSRSRSGEKKSAESAATVKLKGEELARGSVDGR